MEMIICLQRSTPGISTEFINFLSVIIATKIKKLFSDKKLSEKYSLKQLMIYHSKSKKVRIGEVDKWKTLGIVD